jgi:hypothetical protein
MIEVKAGLPRALGNLINEKEACTALVKIVIT